jgi:LmbE family N-acetylglucosaminyl deacetylase
MRSGRPALVHRVDAHGTPFGGKDVPGSISECRRVLALSPHLDDVALSVGGIVARAVENRADVVICTVFTADMPDPALTSPVIQEMNGLWNLGASPFASRRKEDIAAAGRLGARFMHGNMLDAIYRTNRRGGCLYPTKSAIFSDPSPEDDVFPPVRALIDGWLDDVEPDGVLCPLAIGRHVDHVITSESLRVIAAERRLSVFLYEDFPYCTGRFPPERPDSVEATLSRTRWKPSSPETISVDFTVKLDAVAQYDSQVKGLFSTAEEMEIACRQYMAAGNKSDGFCETIWRTRD